MKTGQQFGLDFDLGENVNVLTLAFSPDAKFLACGTSGMKIHILEVPSLKQVNVLTNHTAFVTCLAFDRTGRKLVSGSNDSHIRVWSFPDCSLVAELAGHRGTIGDLAFSPDGVRPASGGSDHTVRLWNLANPGAPTYLHGHRGAVKSVLFSRDGTKLYTGGDDRTVKVWETSSQESTSILRHSGFTADVAFSPAGTHVAVADYGARTAVLWQLPSQLRIGIVGEHSGRCNGVKFSPDGKLLATVGGDDTVQIWNISPRKRLFDFAKLASSGSLAFHPLRPLLAVGCKDLRFWDLQNGARTNLLTAAPDEGVQSVVFAPDGKRMALGMQNGQVSIWDIVTGRLLCSFHEHSAAINALCFSYDGNLLASGGSDNLIALYNVPQGVTARLEGHTVRVTGLLFAPYDKTLVSTSTDGTIRFWSIANHQVALTLAHDGGPVTSVAFSTDGNLMATSGSDGTVRLWPAAKFEDVKVSEKAR